jgi:hypothetical protein
MGPASQRQFVIRNTFEGSHLRYPDFQPFWTIFGERFAAVSSISSLPSLLLGIEPE